MFVFSGVEGGDPKALFKLSVEGGVVGKSAFGCHDIGLLSLLQECARQKKSLENNVIPHGRSRRFLENSVDVGFAEEKFLPEIVKALDGCQVGVDILDDPCHGFRGFLRGGNMKLFGGVLTVVFDVVQFKNYGHEAG